jgi:hypothetical protein
MGYTLDSPPWGPIAKRGRVVLSLGGLRACEGVRGRVRACFTLILEFPLLCSKKKFNFNF